MYSSAALIHSAAYPNKLEWKISIQYCLIVDCYCNKRASLYTQHKHAARCRTCSSSQSFKQLIQLIYKLKMTVSNYKQCFYTHRNHYFERIIFRRLQIHGSDVTTNLTNEKSTKNLPILAIFRRDQQYLERKRQKLIEFNLPTSRCVPQNKIQIWAFTKPKQVKLCPMHQPGHTPKANPPLAPRIQKKNAEKTKSNWHRGVINSIKDKLLHYYRPWTTVPDIAIHIALYILLHTRIFVYTFIDVRGCPSYLLQFFVSSAVSLPDDITRTNWQTTPYWQPASSSSPLSPPQSSPI